MSNPIGVKDAASILGVTEAIVREACQFGTIPHQKFGAYYVMDSDTIIGIDRKGWPPHGFLRPGMKLKPDRCRWCHQAPDAPAHTELRP